MKQNMGMIDRVLRAVVALVIIGAYFAGMIEGTLAIILGVLALVFLATSALGVCPLYMPFKLSTKKD